MAKKEKKQRLAAKRKARQKAIRRAEAGGPWKLLVTSPGQVECWMSEDFEVLGQASFFVYKHSPRMTGVACFLIDRGVVGLKDAWTRTRIERSEFKAMIDASAQRTAPMKRVPVEEVRMWVSGAMRWARDNGMRLPKDWAKPAQLIGGVDGWEHANVSAFELEFAGHPEDLRQRLVGEPFETYIRRKDIDFTFDENVTYMDQETGEYTNSPYDALLDEMEDDDIDDDDDEGPTDEEVDRKLNSMLDNLEPAIAQLVNETRQWLASKGEVGSIELKAAWGSMMLAAMMSKTAVPEASDQKVMELGTEMLEQLGGRIPDERFDEYERAIGQVFSHLETDSMMMQTAVLKYGTNADSKRAADVEGRMAEGS